MTFSVSPTKALIDQLVRSTGATDAPTAMRMKARELIDLYVATFGDSGAPNVDVLASLRGIARSDELPVHSPDAELVPDGNGGVSMRVNPDRPETRQRFSVAHEISHTFFPDYTTKVWCRPDARYRDRNDPDDFLEMLCDIGAAELLFPQPWFSAHAVAVESAIGLLELAGNYGALREATLRRFAEVSETPIAAVFFIWKLKPTQKTTIGRPEQSNFLGVDPAEEARAASRLRIEYAIPSQSFAGQGHFLAKDKSVENVGPLYEAASTGRPCEGECHLDLGPASGTYRVLALPHWTHDDQLGSKGENAVAAILQPLQVRKPKGKAPIAGPTLFD